MALHALNNIANRFYLAKIASTDTCTKAFDKIKKELNLNGDDSFKKNSLKDINYDDHFNDIETIRVYIKENNDYSPIEVENKINYLMSLFIPSQEELDKILSNEEKPFEFLKTLSLVSYYVKKDKNDRNLVWPHNSKYGKLRISINKAKPEKTIDEIKKAKNAVKQKDAPLCPICVENIGYKANAFSDSRENLRVYFQDMPNGDKWFFQYSPYSYLNNHFVLNNITHIPMKISYNSLNNLVYFVKNNPQFFLGSNADLPIVGGSLLGHDHYQGGEDELPVMSAKTIKKYNFLNSEVHILKWPLNTVKISSKNEKELIAIGNYFINNWKHYQTREIQNMDNNSSTLIVNKQDGMYNLFIIFRNNSVSENRPYGNFHFHQDKFNIKQENIGLMEAAGLAILPQRLESELLKICDLVQDNNINEIEKSSTLKKHYEWVKDLISKKKEINNKTILKYASEVFLSGLEDCKVLKDGSFKKFVKLLVVNNEIQLSNNLGLKVKILNQGFTFKDITLNDRSFILNYEKDYSYFTNSILLNSFVGPIAGRIQKESLIIRNEPVEFSVDDQNNNIHSMEYNVAHTAFVLSSIKKEKEYKYITARKKIYNKDFDLFYTFNITLRVYDNKNEIGLAYKITSDKNFIANPTQHFYFNFPSDYKINNYLININKENKVWYLSNNMNPVALKDIDLGNEFNTIGDLADKLGIDQQNIVGGLIDHPFISYKNKITLKNGSYEINLMPKYVKDFVLYTHNFPSEEKLSVSKKPQKNCGVCIEFQNPPLSKRNQNIDDILFKKNKICKNNIAIEIKEILLDDEKIKE